MPSTTVGFDIIARDRASDKFQKVGKSADGFGSKLRSFGKFAAAGALGVGALTGAAAAFTYKVGADYVDSLNKIQALTGANDATMNAAAKTLESNSGLYAKMGQTTGDAATGVVELTKAGLSLHDSLKAVNGTMVLAKAGELSVADASSLVANSLNTFGLKASEAGKIANQLANAANISSADVSDLAESFKYVSPVAASAGVSMAHVNAILAELSNAGIKGSNAGTALRTFLLNLQAPTARAAKEMQALGLNVFNAAGKMKPIGTVIGLLSDKINHLTPERAAVSLNNLFGKVGIAGATTILKEGSKGLAQYTAGVNKAGAAASLAQAKSKGLAGTFAMIKAQTISTAQSLFRQWSPAVNAALLKAIAFAGVLKNQAVPKIKELAATIRTNVVPALQRFFNKVHDNLQPAVVNLERAFRKTKPQIDGFTGALKRAAPQITRMTADAGNLATKLTGKTSPAWAQFARILGGQVINYMSRWINTAGQVAQGLDSQIRLLGHASGALGRFASAFGTAASRAAAFAGTIGGKVRAAVGNLSSILYSAGQQVVQGLINGIESMAGGLLSKAHSLASSVTGAFKGALGIHSPSRVFMKLGINIMEGLSIGLDKGTHLVKNALDKVLAYLSNQRDKMKSLLGAKSSFAQGFQSFTSSVFSTDLSKTSTDAEGNDVTTPATIADMLAYQRQQRTKARTLKGDVKKLHKMGLSNALIRQLEASGESGLEQIHTLAGGNRKQIRELNSLNAETAGALAGAGNIAGSQLYNSAIARTRNNEDLAERIAKKLHRALQEASKGEELVIKDVNGQWIIKAIRKEKRHQGKASAV